LRGEARAFSFADKIVARERAREKQNRLVREDTRKGVADVLKN
jgi:hypothetical protein